VSTQHHRLPRLAHQLGPPFNNHVVAFRHLRLSALFSFRGLLGLLQLLLMLGVPHSRKDNFTKDGSALELLFQGGLGLPSRLGGGRDSSLRLLHVVLGIGLFVLELRNPALEADSQNGVPELGSGLAGLAKLGQQVVVGSRLAGEPAVLQRLLGTLLVHPSKEFQGGDTLFCALPCWSIAYPGRER
jgi:hypothetical protein